MMWIHLSATMEVYSDQSSKYVDFPNEIIEAAKKNFVTAM